jgi:acyl carrier protein
MIPHQSNNFVMNDQKANSVQLKNDGPESGQELAAPAVEFEKLIRNVWSEILDIDEVGPHDDFLDLGGNSVQAMQIISRLNLEFEIEIPLQLLFDGATPADLALAIGEDHE